MVRLMLESGELCLGENTSLEHALLEILLYSDAVFNLVALDKWLETLDLA